MNCNHADLKGYLLGELPPDERRQVEEHLKVSPACQEDLDRLRLTHTALLALRDEEPSRRIAFVSDKVLAPNWRQRFWSAAPRLGFASAALLAVAIVSHGWLTRPPQPATPTLDAAALERQVQAEVQRRLPAAVAQAVAESEARQTRKMAEVLKAAEERLSLETRGQLVAVQEAFDLLNKRMNIMYVASSEVGGAR